jgi:hypothetical protein
MNAIIAGDIINSQQHHPDEYLIVLKEVLSEYSKDEMFQIYRGDSFQALVSKPALALQASIKLKAALKRIDSLDVRIAIGLGTVDIIDNNIAVSSGNALKRSGVLLDSLKEEEQNIMVQSDHPLDQYMNTALKMALLYMDNWTENGAAVVYELLKHPKITQEEIGKKLGVQQATASRRLDRANWKETQQMFLLFEQYFKDISHDAPSTN